MQIRLRSGWLGDDSLSPLEQDGYVAWRGKSAPSPDTDTYDERLQAVRVERRSEGLA
jgi:hypothetical protein